MSRKRNRMEIIASILEECKGGIKKTRLMYKTNLSYRLFCKYTGLLEKKGLITFVNNEYKLTAKGYEQLNRVMEYINLLKKLKEIRESLEDLKDERQLIKR
ncbi:MAG: winged helix-turn-helix domain-containing protein [Saccharolobus sp.]|uniref:ArnR1-like winged helix-turn-helix domain-containing protein n=1 Tax=Saccharolobus shibatae (strain ATCC 51178 / DSM 5389 / JCM 8931 / NBRC 15437 / B12) TaxID=523848 RepID=A0A8F5GTR5_SACSH|nr:winged helix-turn-helix domain-containing protein [Saccharolobus shibatae]MCH4816299.1 winged helix-turn-helix domain-containing protein [Saccharolobus shibatae]QXJ28637.1 hypothetical protein J5U23_01506 [Saccharolobus shibatae B12]